MADREVLLRLFEATGGESWTSRRGWATNEDVDDWFGVTANIESQVVRLDLKHNNLRGTIPQELGDLKFVEKIFLSGNNLRGGIPKEVGDLPALKVLDLQFNKLSGAIPKELGDLKSIERLWLQKNKLSGRIPKELGNLPAIQALDLSSNKLRGVIPKELGDLKSVQQMWLSNNELSGGIPKELGYLPALQWLDLSSNNLSEVPLAFLQALRKRKVNDMKRVLGENPLLRPPQTVMDVGIDQAISWWEDIERFGEGTSNKLKMVLVGLAEAGKTTLVRNITGKTVPTTVDRTVGIEITEGWKPVDGGPLEISIWDFAGQADYYASHQLFLTNGSLFLLVVDLCALFTEASREVEKDGDPYGRVYRWLEMLHLRVPGAAVALVGTHTDAAEFSDSAHLEKAITFLEQLVARYLEDKAKEVAKSEAMHDQKAPDPNEDNGTIHREGQVARPWSSRRPSPHLFIHGKVFRTSLNSNSTTELREWVSKAATLVDCPTGFNFPGVRATIPQVWIDANTAMDGLKVGDAGKRYVTWREAVQTFGYFMETKGTPISDPAEILLRTMRHREAEGSVLLFLEHDLSRLGESAGMLYLDPTWLIEIIRRLTDHNLVDTTKDGTLKNELEKYGRVHSPPLELDTLWEQHRSYRKSGTLNLAYLRFLWLHRQLDDGITLHLNQDEFNIVLATMEALLVLYRAPFIEGKNRALFVVPARLPEYGDEQVLEKGRLGLGDAVVRTRCSFRQSYAPPGVIGRLLAFANAHIKEARECWQHGAHLIWMPGAHDVLVYETHFVEKNDSGSVAHPGLVLCVKGNTPEIRIILDSLKGEVRRFFDDKVHGYPGLCSVVFEDTDEVHVSDLTSDLRTYLDNRFERLEAMVGRVAGVTSEILQAFYLAAEDENQYPRLLILKPDDAGPPHPDIRISPTSGSSATACMAQGGEGDAAAASAEAMQRETWDKWMKALTGRKRFRVVFLCEHDMTEVPCGPGGIGYLVKDLPNLVKACWPLLQVSFYALRVAVGMVAHVDLPLDDLLAAFAISASTEVLGAMGTSIPIPDLTEATPLPDESTGAEEQRQRHRLQKEGYAALCQFMQGLEIPRTSCCGWHLWCSSCGSNLKTDCGCVSWRDEMVRVPNGKGGLVWVKNTNETAYKAKISRGEVERSRASS